MLGCAKQLLIALLYQCVLEALSSVVPVCQTIGLVLLCWNFQNEVCVIIQAEVPRFLVEENSFPVLDYSTRNLILFSPCICRGLPLTYVFGGACVLWSARSVGTTCMKIVTNCQHILEIPTSSSEQGLNKYQFN